MDRTATGNGLMCAVKFGWKKNGILKKGQCRSTCNKLKPYETLWIKGYKVNKTIFPKE